MNDEKAVTKKQWAILVDEVLGLRKQIEIGMQIVWLMMFANVISLTAVFRLMFNSENNMPFLGLVGAFCISLLTMLYKSWKTHR